MATSPFEEFRPQLDLVAEAIEEMARTLSPEVRDLAGYYLSQLGQMLRPGLVLAAARIQGEDPGVAARDLAAVVELVHSASLLHDDVVDEADLRRSRETVHRRWGDRTAVLLGDLLLARALGFLAPHARPAVLAVVARIPRDLAEGQLLELALEGRSQLEVGEYLRMIELKTATFFGHCARLGALAGEADEDAQQALDDFGVALGFSYQILDDLLDVAGAEEAVGKSVGADLENRRPTLPVLRLLEREPASSPVRRSLEGRGGRLAADELARRVRASGAFEAVIEDARGWHRRAREALQRLPPNSRHAPLERLLTYLFTRAEALTGAALRAST